MNYYVYLLFSKKDKGFYIGYTSNLSRRFKEHNYGKVKSTMHRRPLSVIYYECFSSKRDAKVREKYLKSGYGRQQLKIILKNTMERWQSG